jgi:prolyl oligopeptidase
MPHYPDAQRLDVTDVLHGVEVHDPYRWLEDPEQTDTKRWSAAQDALVREHLDRVPGRGATGARLRELLSTGSVTVPVLRGGRAFLTRREPGQEHPVLLVREADGGERVLVDPAALSDDDTVTLDGWVPSIEGDRLAYWLSESGDEEASLWVMDVATGKDVEGPIGRTRYCDLAWLPGAESYVYGRRLDADQVPAGEELFHRRVWRHVVGAGIASDELIFGDNREKTEYHALHVSRDGRWLLLGASLGTAPRNDLYLADLAGDAALRPVQVGVDAETWGRVGNDGLLYLLTNLDAPRNRLVVVDPADPAPERWRVLVAEPADEVLDGFALTTDTVVVTRTRHAVGRVTVHERGTGAQRSEVELPGLGSVAGISAHPDGGHEAWVGYTDFVTPPQVHHVDVRDGTRTLWADAPGGARATGIVTRQETYRSADGTEVRMFILHADEAVPARSGPRPTILYGYGGFNVPLTPGYGPLPPAWIERGGVYAIANLRGGSEEGEAWHRAGMREHKQNVFDDFAAAAEHLIATGWTTREQLGIYGGSNGGLLVGAALVQRPELFRAVVCSAPLLDMVRYERFGFGESWNDEYGRADDPVEFGWLYGYSPYHHVVEGASYPAVLFTVFDSDTRVDPMHARKLCAALQWASRSDLPILLRREAQVGHGARSISRTIDLSVDLLAFLADQLGLPLGLDGRRPAP